MTGTSEARRASSTASSSCSRSENVSRTIRSAPPSSRPSICSRNAARAAASGRSGPPRVGDPSGPTEPPTSASRPLTSRASRASWAARRLSPPTWPSRPQAASRSPVGAERQRLDQLGARLEILAMGRPDHLRMGRDELLETGPLRHAAAEQQRPQPAVDQERTGGETAAEALPRRAGGRERRSSVPYRTGRSGGGTGNDKTLPARKGLEGSSLIVQEDLPGLGTLPARRR